MSGEATIIGSCPLSSSEVAEINDRIAGGWQGHRQFAVIPMIVIGFCVYSYLTKGHLLLLAILGVPMMVLLVATLLLRPHRLAKSIEVTLTMTEERLFLDERIDGKRSSRSSVKWRDIEGYFETEDRLVLVTNNDRLNLPIEIFADRENLRKLTAKVSEMPSASAGAPPLGV